jgi:hypothetical protein
MKHFVKGLNNLRRMGQVSVDEVRKSHAVEAAEFTISL